MMPNNSNVNDEQLFYDYLEKTNHLFLKKTDSISIDEAFLKQFLNRDKKVFQFSKSLVKYFLLAWLLGIMIMLPRFYMGLLVDQVM